jgi:acetyl-CoA carboxylase carboxyltransferase component
MLMHTRGILIMTQAGAMVLTGKRALEASGAVAAEDERAIGGFEDIMGPNGQAQYYAHDLEEAYGILLRHYELTSPRAFASSDPRDRDITTHGCEVEDWSDVPAGATVGDYLSSEANPDRKKAFAIRPVMRALIDADSDWLERWQAMRGAETAVVWDAHLGGHPVCLIGIENRALPREGYAPPDGPAEWAGATLFPASSKKVARSLNAASGQRAVVILANLAGFDGSPESMRELQLEYGAEIARAVVNFRGPILFVVTSRYHGGAYVVFSTRLNGDLEAIALEGSYASVIGGGPAATVIFSGQVRRRTDEDPRVEAVRAELARAVSRFDKAALRSRLAAVRQEVEVEHHKAVAAEFDRVHSVERARAVGSVDEIVAASDLRRVLIDKLDLYRPETADAT